MSGHGFKLSPAVGEMMAGLIIGSTPPPSLAPFRLNRFSCSVGSGTFVSSYLR
jgi:glycine/D-amino acid oxidase-like deaminating enzyme